MTKCLKMTKYNHFFDGGRILLSDARGTYDTDALHQRGGQVFGDQRENGLHAHFGKRASGVQGDGQVDFSPASG
ncbi:hypothetical protein DESC_780122 [Desulfosarcina cetonica]|nr:hypothetical protein DESC_780122 [Desulfosarcina cetonica]